MSDDLGLEFGKKEVQDYIEKLKADGEYEKVEQLTKIISELDPDRAEFEYHMYGYLKMTFGMCVGEIAKRVTQRLLVKYFD